MAKRDQSSDPPENKAWSSRISALMDAANLTPEALARQMKVDRSTAYSWRNGTRIPSRKMQKKLAKHLGTSIARLNGWPS